MIHPIRQKTPPNIYSHITAIQSLSDRDRGLCCFRTRFNFDNARRRKDMKAIDYSNVFQIPVSPPRSMFKIYIWAQNLCHRLNLLRLVCLKSAIWRNWIKTLRKSITIWH